MTASIVASTNKDLKTFLRYLHDNYDDLSVDQRELVLQHYSKHALLETREPVQQDDWDYISLGILLKTMIQQAKA